MAVGTAEVSVFVGIKEGGVTVGVGVSAGATEVGVAVGATGVGVVPSSLVQAILNSKRGAARAMDRFLIAGKNMDSIISVQYLGDSGWIYLCISECSHGQAAYLLSAS